MVAPKLLIVPAVDDDLLTGLPPIVKAVVKALGFGRASQFLTEYGGMPAYIAQIKPRSMGLTETELNALRQTLKPHLDSGNYIHLPKADKLFAKVRDRAIVKQAQSKSIKQQAREYKLTTRQIINIRKELSKDEKLQTNESRKQLVLSADELKALQLLTERATQTKTPAPIYFKLLNKLSRAALLAPTKHKTSQFDLF